MNALIDVLAALAIAIAVVAVCLPKTARWRPWLFVLGAALCWIDYLLMLATKGG